MRCFASYSVLELDNFDSGLLVSHPLYASTKHDSFLCEKKIWKNLFFEYNQISAETRFLGLKLLFQKKSASLVFYNPS